MAQKTTLIPSFRTEKQEAAWWDAHRAEVEANLRQSMRKGRAVSLQDALSEARRKQALRSVTIRLPSEDLDTARRLAVDKGIGYQTYIKLLLHEALRKEARQRGAK